MKLKDLRLVLDDKMKVSLQCCDIQKDGSLKDHEFCRGRWEQVLKTIDTLENKDNKTDREKRAAKYFRESEVIYMNLVQLAGETCLMIQLEERDIMRDWA